jgi:hypothetical protein
VQCGLEAQSLSLTLAAAGAGADADADAQCLPAVFGNGLGVNHETLQLNPIDLAPSRRQSISQKLLIHSQHYIYFYTLHSHPPTSYVIINGHEYVRERFFCDCHLCGHGGLETNQWFRRS